MTYHFHRRKVSEIQVYDRPRVWLKMTKKDIMRLNLNQIKVAQVVKVVRLK